MFSKYEIYTTTQSVYCYKDTNVLKNKLEIKELSALKEAEEEIAAIKQAELLQKPISGRFTKTHLFNIHKFIFEDIYPFAGKIRKEQISKSTTMFYPPHLIDEYLDRLFDKIKRENMLEAKTRPEILNNLAYIMAELNIIHPFREGNGRAIREFIRIIAERCGYEIDWKRVNKEEVIKCSILSVDDYTALISLLDKCMGNSVK